MENVRVDSLLGNKKVIVGNPYSDIVLETLGKVYIKSGRNCKLLDDVIKELATITEKPQEEVYAKTIIVNSVDELESLDYPGDGYLIYNSLNKSLYISYEDKYIALIESVADTSENYVKKTGDSMSGQLEITVDAFPPLIVHSKKLVSNLNANYLEGYAAKDLAKKKVDEIISGDWTFTGSNISKANWRFYRDIIVDGSITSPFFSSGFSGSGWRIDATTNTLTIDYLVVRKAMQVYEMVVNKITATNGSLWVSNASKVENFVLAYETTTTEFLNEFNEAYKNASGGTDFTELDDLARSLLTSLLSQRTDIIFNDKNVRAYIVGDSSWQCPAILTHITDAYALANSTLFTNINQLWDKSFLDSINIEDPQTPETLAINNSAQAIDLFSESGPESYMDIVSDDNKSIIKKPLYYSYFYGTENIYVVDFDDDEIPVFKPGDIVRCQKWDNQNIKYYDAIVLASIGLHSFAIQLAKSVFDKYTEVSYDEKGNISEIVEKYNDNLYDRTDWTPSDDDLDYEGEPVQEEEIKKKLATVEIGDSIVQVGNIKPDSGRQNAIYLTSSDDQAPYINILSDLNRPDYSVLYKIPKYDEEGNPITKKDEEGNFVEYEFEYTKTTKVRIGNLGGIIDSTFPENKQPRGYGLYADNVYLTGEFYLNNGTSIVDFSKESILLKFRNAGLEIKDVVNEDGTIDQVPALNLEGEPILDEDGNPTYRNKTEIYMNADQFVFSIAGNPAMKLSGLLNDKGQFQEALLDVQGAVQSRGLRVQDTEMSSRPPFTWDPDLEIYIDAAGDYVTQEGYYINSFINTKGNLYARNGYFKGEVNADSGTFNGTVNADRGSIGGFKIGSGRIGSEVNTEYDGGELAIYNNLIRVGNSDSYSLLGGDTIPTTAGGAYTSTCRFVNNTKNDSYNGANYGMMINVSGAERNYGISSNAPILATSCIGMKIARPIYWVNYKSDDGKEFDFSKYSVYLIASDRNMGLNLPDESTVASYFGLTSLPVDFSLMFTLHVRPWSYDIRVNNVYDWNANLINIDMIKGDSLTLLISKYDGFRYDVLNRQD